jgi:adenosylcobinamide-GDP ribazoletransferase
MDGCRDRGAGKKSGFVESAVDSVMWRGLISSIQFLTIIPCGHTRHFEPRGALVFFPICGLLVGGMLLLADTVAGIFWDPAAAAVVGMVTLVVVSGALHLDGLADTADGLYGRRGPDEALAIMKDSRIGSIGMVAVVCCLAVKWAGLAGIEVQRPVWLLLVPAFARSTVLFGIWLLPYGRPEGGTAHTFFQQTPRLRDFWGLGLLLGLTFLLTGWGVVWIGAGTAAWVAVVLVYYRLKVNCITGDMLGAMIETTEAGLFLLIAAASQVA